MTILVTGANGYLGQAILARYEGPDPIVAATRTGTAAHPGQRVDAQASCELSDCGEVESLLKRFTPTAILHCAAKISSEATDETRRELLNANVVGTSLLASMAPAHGCRLFVNASTAEIYGKRPLSESPAEETQTVSPVSVYAKSKWLGEHAVALASGPSMRSISIRFAGLHGPRRRSGAPARFLANALEGRVLALRGSGSVFQFLSVDDAANAMLAPLKADLPAGHTVCNVAGRDAWPLLDWARLAIELAGTDVKIDARDVDQTPASSAISIARANSLLGFSPIATTRWMTDLLRFLSKPVPDPGDAP